MKKKTNEEFIINAKRVHGNKYDYSKTKYVNSRTKVKIICPIHGMFEQIANSHLQGQGCPKCKYIRFAKSKRSKWEDLVVRFKQKHGDKYLYKKLEFTSQHDKLEIFCIKHKIWFKQRIVHHLNGHGCPICHGGKHRTNEEFIAKARLIHNDKYDYSKVKYTVKSAKVEIICRKHGSFWQTANDHLNGCGCPRCKSYKTQEQIFLFLQQNFPNEKWEWECSPNWLKPQKFDIYNRKHNLAIEYNGEQHYMPIKKYGGVLGYEDCIKRDKRKNELCKKNKCTLYIVKYDNINYDKIREEINNIINN